MDIEYIYERFLQCTGVTTDSRNCPEGSMFFALKGDTFNGNAFAAKALEAGCKYTVVDEETHVVAGDSRYILVQDCLQTLQELANHHRRQLKTPVIGITGTNGKTTTKELIAAVMSAQYPVLYTQGNLNNHIGVPLTLLRLTSQHKYAVVEMGANHPGEIDRLVHIAEPDFGIVTNVGKAHLEGFGSFEGVKKTKKELYDYLKAKGDCPVFIHHDNPHLLQMAEGLSQIGYGSEPDLYIHGNAISDSAFLTLQWGKAHEDASQIVKTNLIGDYNLPNVLAAITIGTYFGITPDRINRALESYTPSNNRSQLKETKYNRLIIDAYNANPTSMMAALQNFEHMNTAPKMMILGDMRELGAESMAEHQRIVDYLQTCQTEQIWLVGTQFCQTQHSFRTFSHVDELIQALQQERPQGYTILLKGSNGIHLNQAIDYL